MQEIVQDGKVTHIRLVRGDSFYATLTIERNGETYTPVEGDVISFAMSKDGVTAVEKTVDNETLLLAIYPADTADLEYGVYSFDIQITTVGGDVDTFIRGDFTLEKEVA